MKKTQTHTLIDLNSFPVRPVLKYLLRDKTTKQNIIFATDTYTIDGEAIGQTEQITKDLILRMGDDPIQPRCTKSRQEQADRTRKNAEVFTPTWICNRMNNYCDAEWFGRENVFNSGDDRIWAPTLRKISFPKGKRWQRYVDSRRLEITCGEAPFLVSRYDSADGSPVPLHDRIGILDRKMRVVNENTETEEDWLKWAYRALQSVYGYEYQGDNLLIARINLLMSFTEYLRDRLNREPTKRELRKAATIISWNIWQMDGLSGTVPLLEREAVILSPSLFGNDPTVYEPIPCRIYDWRGQTSMLYSSLKWS